jgi:hypothetical protein
MNPLFEIAQLKPRIDALLAAYPEIAEDEILRADMFAGELNLDNVLSTILDKALQAASMQEAIATRQKDLASRKARFAKQEEALRGFMLTIMEMAGLQSMPLPEATLSCSFRKPEVMVVDETKLPDYCLKMTVIHKPDMAFIKSEYERHGVLLGGCTLTNGKNILRVLAK